MSLKITKAGILDTVQDLGRYGHQHLGINPSGAMDRFSASLANALLGKEVAAPVIELHFPAAQILFRKPSVICLTGADFSPVMNGTAVPLYQPVLVAEETVLQFTQVRKGARCYLSALNKWQLDKWLNSYSTNLKASAGGNKGRKLVKDDEIFFESMTLPQTMSAFQPLPWRYTNQTFASGELPFIPGNEWDWLTTKSQTAFLNNSFPITVSSDRMGYRLNGEALEQRAGQQLVSSAVSFGTVQLLPNGSLIVLMADHQTTGGYPRVAHINSTHLPTLAQMQPGEIVRFTMTTLDEAEEKLATQQLLLQQLQNTCNLKMKKWLHAH